MSEEFVNMANLIDKSKVEVIETEPKEPASGADAASQADAAKSEEQRLAEDKAKADKAAADAAPKSETKSETMPDLSKIAGGKFKTINELETRITELEDYAKTRGELAQLRKLKEQHEELVSSYSQFEDMDEVTGKLAILKKKDPEKGKVFERILNSDDSISVLKECLKHNNPRYKNDPKLLEARIKKDYGILFDPDDEQDSDEYLIAKDELETRAEEEKAKALKELDSIKLPKKLTEEEKKAKQAEVERNANELAASWTPFIENEFSTFKEMELVLEGDDKIIVNVADIPQEERKLLFDMAVRQIVGTGTKPTDESKANFKGLVNSMFWATNYQRLLKQAILSDRIEQKKLIDNPGGKTPPPSGSEQAIDQSQEFVHNIAKSVGLK